MRRQDLRVESFIDYHEIYTDVFNHSEDMILLVKHKHPELDYFNTFVISWKEPDKTFLPLNVIWICFDPNSSYYQKALRRVSKEKSEEFNHTWKTLLLFDELWEVQYYEATDLQNVNINFPSNATDKTYGIAKLLSDENASTVIVDSDERLSNDRKPKPHVHDEQPITIFESNANDINVKTDDSNSYIGKALVLDPSSKFGWDFLKDDNVDLNG